MAKLPTNYKDDVLDISINESRKFNLINNADGTVSFEDRTVYLAEGTTFGGADINKTNAKVNSLNDKMNFLTGGFVLRDVTFNLTTKKAEINDSRFTAMSLAMVYFHDEYKDRVSDANVIADTKDGKIVFESIDPIMSNVICDIYVVGESEEE